MNFPDWVEKRSLVGKELRDERVQKLTDQWWQARVERNKELADEIKDTLNIRYNTVVMEGYNREDAEEIDRLMSMYRTACSEGDKLAMTNIRRILSSEYDIAIFT